MSRGDRRRTEAREDRIEIRGASEHNLRSVDLVIPRGKLVAVAGVSGSGKSSFVFDTLFAEGRRRYMESLDLPGRPTGSVLARPAFDSIQGLTPTLAVRSRSTWRLTARSTVGTMTEVHDFLRVLFARAGVPHCPRCGAQVRSLTVQEIVQELARMPAGTKFLLVSPLPDLVPVEEAIDQARREGFVRVRLDREILDLSHEPLDLAGRGGPVDLVVDRLVAKGETTARLADSIELALAKGRGRMTAVIQEEGGWVERRFSTKRLCFECGIELPEPHPRLFSFNHPDGMCRACEGLGTHAGEPGGDPCPECAGGRLRPESRAVRLAGTTLDELTRRPLGQTALFFRSVNLEGTELEIAAPAIVEIQSRLDTLVAMGLEYLPLDRSATELAAGEAQRVRLAEILGSRLTGVTYCLDEPTCALHPADVGRLLGPIRDLVRAGNTVVLVDHRPDAILAADHVVEFGPGAGTLGGEVVFEGTPEALVRARTSLTGGYLTGRSRVGRNAHPARGAADRWIRLAGARAKNLRSIDVAFPLGRIVGVAGVSGAGKTSLVMGALAPALAGLEPAGRFAAVEISNGPVPVVRVDEAALGRSLRSNPATYVKAWDEIRRLYAALQESKIRGYTAARFSTNVPGGRCEACQGEGVRRIPMHYLPDVEVACDVCEGKRFGDSTLTVRYRGLSIADVLELTVSEATSAFSKIDRVASRLSLLERVGLGYLRLGQPSSTLSAGEGQRLRLARELARPAPASTIYLFDEPTQGLHPHDVQALVGLTDDLVAAGHTAISASHDLDYLACCDWLIELGPGPGDEGGRVIAEATPAELALVCDSPTGRALAARAGRTSARRSS